MLEEGRPREAEDFCKRELEIRGAHLNMEPDDFSVARMLLCMLDQCVREAARPGEANERFSSNETGDQGDEAGSRPLCQFVVRIRLVRSRGGEAVGGGRSSRGCWVFWR